MKQAETAIRRPLLRYHGGKWMIAPWVIGLFPPHRVYVEPYGGGASVLLRKERSYAEVYNDLDSEVVNLFRVVRDRGEELRHKLALTPFAREEYQLAWMQAKNPLEQARRTVIRSFMGFGSAAVTMKRKVARSIDDAPGTGFRSNSNRSGTTPAHDWKNFGGTGFRTYTGESNGRKNRGALPCGDWKNHESALAPIVERLQGVVIENKDALEVIQIHDGEQTLHYCDPPYPGSTRDKGIDYVHEMTDDQHRELAQVLHSAKGMVVLSGYACDLYDRDLYPDWKRVERASLADGARKRTEVLWINPAAAGKIKQKSLFERNA